jgi:hypothetical protein
MAQDFVIDDSQLARYITQLVGVPRKVSTRSSRWVRKMTHYTERNMKKFSRSKSDRSTGKLSSSISSKYNLTNKYIEGVVFVPSDIKYQFAAEYGIKRRYVIHGNPKMTFPAEHWKKAKRSTVAVPHRGYFVFSKVIRGRYKGRRFTERSFDKLKQYYEKNKTKIMSDIGNSILFAR